MLRQINGWNVKSHRQLAGHSGKLCHTRRAFGLIHQGFSWVLFTAISQSHSIILCEVILIPCNFLEVDLCHALESNVKISPFRQLRFCLEELTFVTNNKISKPEGTVELINS